MRTQKKLFFLFATILSLAFLSLIIIASISFYNLNNKQVTEKAYMATKLIEDGLTSHMVNGTMDKRDFFLRRIESSKNIQEVWIARAPSVVRQFGRGFNSEVPRDDIDKQVINTGKPYQKLIEDAQRVNLRFTMPYIATSYGVPNCMSCHDAKDGEVLGSISMVFNVTETRTEGITAIVYITFISIVVMIFVLLALNYSLKPIWMLFDSINKVMKYAGSGDYSRRVEIKGEDSEAKRVATWINNFLHKLETTLDYIQLNVKDFFVSYQHNEKDPLLDTEQVILEMANIYRFKNTIEYDEDKFTVYDRLATILKQYLKLDNFRFFEINNRTGETLCVYGLDKNQDLNNNIKHRVLHTRKYVSSDQFDNVCYTDKDINLNRHYLCIPYTISDDFDLLIHFSFVNDLPLESTKNMIPKITNYVDAARPELVSKSLTEILRYSSTTDQLTGLYNRKFLDEFIEKTEPQAVRTNTSYGILMLDIDFFKVVNDTYGHDVGDNVIRILSKSVLNSIRESDIAFRYGGEEFLVMLYNCNDEKIDNIANKIRTSFSGEIITTSSGDNFFKTLSIGYSSFPKDTNSIWKCIKYADIALYEAKRMGRNRVVKFKYSMIENEDIKHIY